MRRTRVIASVLAATSIAALVAACSPGGTSTTNNNTSPSASAVSTTLPTTPITLTLAYCDTGAKTFAQAFTQLHPNITFTYQSEGCDSYQQDLVNKMQSSNPPDVAEYLDASIQTLVPGNYVLNLDPYAAAYNWSQSFPKSLMEQLQLSANGKTHGTGSQYGVPGEAVFTGVFYNKSLMTKAGITSVPTTIDEFQADMAKAKAAGITPLALGAQDSGGIHLWGGLALSLAGVTNFQNWVFGAPGSTIDNAGATQAATYLQTWNKDGYYSASPNGTIENDSRAAFVKGQALFTVDGSWSVGSGAIPAGSTDFGFFPFPVAKSGDPVTGQGFVFAFAGSAKTKYPNVVAAFMNFLGSSQVANIVTKQFGALAINPATAPAPVGGVSTDLFNGYKAALADNGIVTFLDHATPTMGTTLTQGLQGVISGQLSPADFIKQAQADWTKNQSK